MEKLALVLLVQASVAVSVKVEAPPEIGVPVMDRVKSELVSMVSPAGSAPLVTWNAGEGENGVTQPPEVVSNCL